MRTVIALVLCAGLQVVLRFVFQGVPIIPHYLEFNPGVALVPASGCFLGPWGAVASLAASVFGDYWAGTLNTLSIFRAAGVFFFAISSTALWPIGRRLGWLGLMVCSLVGSCIAASWIGWGMDLTRSYPFTYVATLALLHDAVFCIVMAPGLYYIGRGLAEEPTGRWSFQAMWWVFSGAVGAWLIGIFVSATFYRDWPLARYHLSDYTGVGLALCVLPFLILNALGVFRRV